MFMCVHHGEIKTAAKSVGVKKNLVNVLMYLHLHCGVCVLTRLFAYSGQVLIHSVYSHNLPVMLQS